MRVSKDVCVLQLDRTTGNVIQTFGSLHEAARAIGVPGGEGNISKVVNGNASSAYGFGWRYTCAVKDGHADEEWKPFEDVYVSNYGRIRRKLASGDEYVQDMDSYKSTTPVATIKGKRWPLHRLVAHVFLDLPADSHAKIQLKDNNPFNPSVHNIAMVAKKRVAEDDGGKQYAKAKRSVEQWTHDGQVMLNRFESVAEAARQLKIDRSHINKCAQGNEKTAGGYTFKFASSV